MAEQTMVERIARAICLVHGRDPDEDAPRSAICGPNNELLPWWRFYEEDARGTLGAMREPTEAMLSAVLHEDSSLADRDNAYGTWRAMIDAALAEGKHDG